MVDVEIRAAHRVVEQLPEAGGRLRFPLLLVEKFGGENGSEGKLSRRGAGIVEERRIAGGGPVDAAPPRQQNRHLQPVGVVDVGALFRRAGEGRRGERFGLRQIAPAALGKGGGIAEAGLRAERLRLRRYEMVDEFRQTILDPPHQHLDRLDGIGFCIPARLEAGVNHGDGKRAGFITTPCRNQQADPVAGKEAGCLAINARLSCATSPLRSLASTAVEQLKRRPGPFQVLRAGRGIDRSGETGQRTQKLRRRTRARPQAGDDGRGRVWPGRIICLPLPGQQGGSDARATGGAIESHDPRQGLDARAIVQTQQPLHHPQPVGQIPPLLEQIEQLCHFGRVVGHAQRDRIDNPPGAQGHLQIGGQFGGCQQGIDRRGADRFQLGGGRFARVIVGGAEIIDQFSDRGCRGLARRGRRRAGLKPLLTCRHQPYCQPTGRCHTTPLGRRPARSWRSLCHGDSSRASLITVGCIGPPQGGRSAEAFVTPVRRRRAQSPSHGLSRASRAGCRGRRAFFWRRPVCR